MNGIGITSGNYVRLTVTSTLYGNSSATSATQWTYTTGTITIGSITQATTTTVNIPWTFTVYTGSETLQVLTSTDGTNFSTFGSSTTVGSSPLNGLAIPTGNYVQLSVTSTLYGNASTTSASKVTYAIGSINASITQTQTAYNQKTIGFTTTNYPNGTTFTLYLSLIHI